MMRFQCDEKNEYSICVLQYGAVAFKIMTSRCSVSPSWGEELDVKILEVAD